MDTCDNFEKSDGLRKEKKEKKNFNFLIPILILFIVFLIPTINHLNRIVKKKEANEQYAYFLEQRKREISFDEFVLDKKSKKIQIYIGSFFTEDSLCPIERFNRKVNDSFYKLPKEIEKEDTIKLFNMLFYVGQDSSLRVIQSIEGYFIQTDNGRRFEKIDNAE